MPPRKNYYRAPRRGRVGQRGNVQAETRGNANPKIESEDRTPNVEQPPPPPPQLCLFCSLIPGY